MCYLALYYYSVLINNLGVGHKSILVIILILPVFPHGTKPPNFRQPFLITLKRQTFTHLKSSAFKVNVKQQLQLGGFVPCGKTD